MIRSDQMSRSVVSDPLRPHESQHTRPPCPSVRTLRLMFLTDLSGKLWRIDWKVTKEGSAAKKRCFKSSRQETAVVRPWVKVKVAQSCPTLWHPMDSPWNSPGQNIGMGSLSLLQGIFPTQGLNPGLPHCRQIIYQLSHQGSPEYSIKKLRWWHLVSSLHGK